MSNQNQGVSSGVTVNAEQGLYVIPSGGGYSCLGFSNCQNKAVALAAELGKEPPSCPVGSIEYYDAYENLVDEARELHRKEGRVFRCGLTPQLDGLEGRRVEVVNAEGEKRRFWVGKSTGWIPCHLEIKTSRSLGGCPAEKNYQSVRVL